jgi:hypothetical protein
MTFLVGWLPFKYVLVGSFLEEDRLFGRQHLNPDKYLLVGIYVSPWKLSIRPRRVNRFPAVNPERERPKEATQQIAPQAH